jgi:hypothetical protein
MTRKSMPSGDEPMGESRFSRTSDLVCSDVMRNEALR